ncbi:hypothetical protein LINPERPRIM_LOCUS24977 [Linum perenne]
MRPCSRPFVSGFAFRKSPLNIFYATVLKIIGDRIGKTVRIDHTTLEGSRGNLARICVEVDLSKPLLSKYRMRRRVRRIEYEGLHTICFNCGCYGHKAGDCKQAPDEEVQDNQTTSFSNPVFQAAVEVDLRPEVDEDFGPWMQAKKNRHKTKQINPPAVISTAADRPPLAPPVSAPVAKKGNRFSVLSNNESSSEQNQLINAANSKPLQNPIVGDSIVIFVAGNKDNLSPYNSASIPPSVPQETVPNLGLGQPAKAHGQNPTSAPCLVKKATASGLHAPTKDKAIAVSGISSSSQPVISSSSQLASGNAGQKKGAHTQ